MLGGKKKKANEVRWMLTFADLITLLFCFFVYLSLFNKPQVDLKTGFVVNAATIDTLKNRLPDNTVNSLGSMMGVFFDNKENFEEKLETLIGKKQTSLYKTQILIESMAKGQVDESAGVLKVVVLLNEKVEEDLRIPLFFSGSARRGPVDAELCTSEGLTANPTEIQEFDYILGSEVAVIPQGEYETFFPLCIINDELYEDSEEILVQIGKLRGDVERGNFVSRSIFIQDDEPLPSVSFEVSRRDLYKGISNITAKISPVSGVITEIPIKFAGTAKEKKDFRFMDGATIKIYPYTEKGTVEMEVLQDEVPLYATRTLVVQMDALAIKNAETGRISKQVNTIIGAQEMKDCSGINRFLRENEDFASFELNASKSRCILSLPSSFLFPSGGAAIVQEVEVQLQQFLSEIRDRYELEGDAIRVDGHTDDVPLRKKSKFRNNWELSTVRATVVATLMMEKVGFNPERIAISGYAETRPKKSYLSEDGKRKSGKELKAARKANRRVDLIFTRPVKKERTRKFFPDPDEG
ncbi:MAG: OmpA family protein [SAR324 cluster bacterium]|nr:OmpA family protein [SAR324 cluster bacterium]MBL7035207.1 OmpA family protein [SAR324 cluster bacterium]